MQNLFLWRQPQLGVANRSPCSRYQNCFIEPQVSTQTHTTTTWVEQTLRQDDHAAAQLVDNAEEEQPKLLPFALIIDFQNTLL
jgi:hypothetical protein